jgi:hypothetical protein
MNIYSQTLVIIKFVPFFPELGYHMGKQALSSLLSDVRQQDSHFKIVQHKTSMLSIYQVTLSL